MKTAVFDRSLFRLLILLYPRRFRQRFGPDMLADFDASRAACRNRRDLVAFWLHLFWDFLTTLPRAVWHVPINHRQQPSRQRERNVRDGLMKDIRLAFRGLVRRPGATFIAVLALGLGIGLTTGMFSVVNGVILKGLPVENARDLLTINRINPSQSQSRLLTRIQDFADLRERQVTFEDLAAYQVSPFNLSSEDGPPELANGANVTTNTFDVLRTPPVVGRGFVEADGLVGAQPVALIGSRMWEERFNRSPTAVGETIRLDGQSTEIIGVMPEDFEFPFNQQVWRPLPASDLSLARGTGPLIMAFGRLARGFSAKQGQADLSRIMAELAVEYPDTNEGMTVVTGPFINEVIGYQVPSLLYTMLAAVSLVLLIACANVANLLLARAILRRKEVALKTALGASRSRVVAQLLVEASVIAGLGAILGLGVAQIWIVQFNRILSGFPQGVPFWFSVRLDPAVLLFVVVLTVTASLLSGFVPALRASRADVNDVLKDDTRGSSSLSIGRLSRALVVAEVAFSCALLVAAGLVIKSVTNLSRRDVPFDGDDVFVATLSLPPASYPDDPSRLRLLDQLRERLDAEPGVLVSSITTELPMAGFANGRFEIENETYLGDRDYPSARIGAIDDAYFKTVSSNMIEGRAFEPTDDEGSAPVAIVNAKFARTYFGTESALGRRVKLRRVSQPGVEIRERDDWYTIVGVAPDFYLEGDAFVLNPEAIYVPLSQRAASVVNLMIQTRGDPLQKTARVRQIVADLDPDLPISQVNTLSGAIRPITGFFSVFGTIFSVFGAAALLLASIGLYGVLSFSVNQRRHELGLRVALGATRGRVLRWVFGQAGMQLAIGIGLGIGLSLALGKAISFVLFGVASSDLGVLAGVAGVMAATGLIACLVPATRATRADPMVAMHTP